MRSRDLTTKAPGGRSGSASPFVVLSGKARFAPIVLAPALLLGGCINVKAPDKPIVIELNVNIRQEVVYRLAQDAENTIQSNPEIF